ncbi:MAG: hypothetical protein QN206_12420 [Armatimonadota bacterium]|nr:hypothetical protein [Armatimonadota bacterium]
MNQVTAICEVIKIWFYNSDVKVRVRMRRPSFISPKEEGPFDFVTIVFPGARRMGLKLQPGQRIWVAGVLVSRDMDQPVEEVLGGEIPEQLRGRKIRFNFNEIVVLNWQSISE